jgi:hypothetical protein
MDSLRDIVLPHREFSVRPRKVRRHVAPGTFQVRGSGDWSLLFRLFSVAVRAQKVNRGQLIWKLAARFAPSAWELRADVATAGHVLLAT